jgi:hypothetical protein
LPPPSLAVSPLNPAQLPSLTGTERFTAADATVLDFWRWALGDLRMNNARGYLAEFLVARALGSTAPIRIEWGAHDVTAADGTRVEVKSSGYLQSWGQRSLSVPRFGLTGAKLVWSEASGEYRADPAGRVDLWVFALHTCRERDRYDPLAVEQWRFWAAPNHTVEDWKQKSAGIAFMERNLGQPVEWGGLVEVVASCAPPQAGMR